jgi:hypothetical protein
LKYDVIIEDDYGSIIEIHNPTIGTGYLDCGCFEQDSEDEKHNAIQIY